MDYAAALKEALAKPESAAERVDAVSRAAKEYLLHHPTLPSDDGIRMKVYRLMLGIPEDLDIQAENAAVSSVEKNIPNQRTISVDAERTRAQLDVFRTPEAISRIENILTYFCKQGYVCRAAKDIEKLGSLEGVTYRQGCNEILAVFLLLNNDGEITSRMEIPDGLAAQLLAHMVSRFFPRIYGSNDNDFLSLQCSLSMFWQLLQYHDPQLSAFLDTFSVTPVMYATPWLLTMFSRGASAEHLFALWDFLICAFPYPGPALFHAVALAFLISHRDDVLACNTEGTSAITLPMLLSRLQFRDQKHVRDVCFLALDLLQATPLSFRRRLHNVCYSGGHSSRKAMEKPIPISQRLLKHLERSVVLGVSIEELLQGTRSRFASPGDGGDAGDLDQQSKDGNKQTASSDSTSSRSKMEYFFPEYYDEYTGTSLSQDSAGSQETLAMSNEKKRAESDSHRDAIIAATGITDATDAASPKPDDVTDSDAKPTVDTELLNTSFSSLFPKTPPLLDPSQWSQPPRYLLLDCRTKAEIKGGGHLPTGIHVDPDLLLNAESLTTVLDQFRSILGTHIVILGAGDATKWYHAPYQPPAPPVTGAGAQPVQPESQHDREAEAALRYGLDLLDAEFGDDDRSDAGAGDADARSETNDRRLYPRGRDFSTLFAALLVGNGFPRVSVLEGGFAALHQHQHHYIDAVLVNHCPILCPVCGEKRNAFRDECEEDLADDIDDSWSTLSYEEGIAQETEKADDKKQGENVSDAESEDAFRGFEGFQIEVEDDDGTEDLVIVGDLPKASPVDTNAAKSNSGEDAKKEKEKSADGKSRRRRRKVSKEELQRIEDEKAAALGREHRLRKRFLLDFRRRAGPSEPTHPLLAASYDPTAHPRQLRRLGGGASTTGAASVAASAAPTTPAKALVDALAETGSTLLARSTLLDGAAAASASASGVSGPVSPVAFWALSLNDFLSSWNQVPGKPAYARFDGAEDGTEGEDGEDDEDESDSAHSSDSDEEEEEDTAPTIHGLLDAVSARQSGLSFDWIFTNADEREDASGLPRAADSWSSNPDAMNESGFVLIEVENQKHWVPKRSFDEIQPPKELLGILDHDDHGCAILAEFVHLEMHLDIQEYLSEQKGLVKYPTKRK